MRLHPVRASAALAVGALSLSASVTVAACATADESGVVDDDSGRLAIPDSGDGGSVSDDATAEPDAPLPCTDANLCRIATPLTVGYVTSLSGRSRSDVWASGTRGLLMRWNGERWSSVDSTITDTLSSLAVTADETWGIAGTLVMRRRDDMNSVRKLRVNEFIHALSGVAVLSNGDVYLSYSPGYVLETKPNSLAKIVDFDSGSIEPVPDPVLAGTDRVEQLSVRALFLVPDKALWLVGDRARVARYPVPPTGGGTVLPVASQATLLAAWGYGDELWAAGTGGTLVHFDGTAWTTEATGTSETLRAIFGFSAKDIWAAGDRGTVLHFDGVTWSTIPVDGYRGTLMAIWGSGPDDVWIGGEGAMFHWGSIP